MRYKEIRELIQFHKIAKPVPFDLSPFCGERDREEKGDKEYDCSNPLPDIRETIEYRYYIPHILGY